MSTIYKWRKPITISKGSTWRGKVDQGRYSLIYIMFWYTIYPSIIEPSRRAHCLTKPFKNCKCLSNIHMDLECTGPHNSISSTWCMSQCSCALKKSEGRCFCISHIKRRIYLLQYFISSMDLFIWQPSISDANQSRDLTKKNIILHNMN